MLKYFNYRTPRVVFATVILLLSESTSSLSSHPLPATVALKLTKKNAANATVNNSIPFLQFSRGHCSFV